MNELFCPKPVWPDVGKSSPIFIYKVDQKVTTDVFNLKNEVVWNSPKSHQKFGPLLKEILLPRRSKNGPIWSHCLKLDFREKWKEFEKFVPIFCVFENSLDSSRPFFIGWTTLQFLAKILQFWPNFTALGRLHMTTYPSAIIISVTRWLSYLLLGTQLRIAP